MQDTASSLFYLFSTMAQVLAAVVAVTAVFVFAKSKEYRGKMQREMGNVLNVYDRLLARDPENEDIKERKTRITKAERHGVFIEMKDIFAATEEHVRSHSPEEAKKVVEACLNGKSNFGYNADLFKEFAWLVCVALALMILDLAGIFLTTWLVAHQPAACWSGALTVFVALCFFVWLAIFILRTTKERSRYTERK